MLISGIRSGIAMPEAGLAIQNKPQSSIFAVTPSSLFEDSFESRYVSVSWDDAQELLPCIKACVCTINFILVNVLLRKLKWTLQ